MINLLPDDVKSGLGFARRNSRLRRKSVTLIAVIASLLLVAGLGALYISRSTNSYKKQVSAAKQSLEAQNEDEINAQVADLTGNVKLVIQVLSREILFSKLINQIGATMPRGSVLTSLSINKVEGGIDLQALAADYQTATQVQVNLKDPDSKVFASADIVNVQCVNAKSESSNPLSSKYPCSVQIRALFAKDNPFLFISKSSGGGS